MTWFEGPVKIYLRLKFQKTFFNDLSIDGLIEIAKMSEIRRALNSFNKAIGFTKSEKETDPLEKIKPKVSLTRLFNFVFFGDLASYFLIKNFSSDHKLYTCCLIILKISIFLT